MVGQRRTELDAARGLMLVWMALTHLPTVVSTASSEPIGFATAAEGFIFLSGLFCGLIYCRLAMRSGHAAMTARLSKRALRLYGYHLAMLGVAFLVVAPIAARGGVPGLQNLLDYYDAAGPPHAIHAMLDAAALIYQPPLLDILPMYIVFMLATPLVLVTARRIGWRWVLGASALVWLGAQLGMREAVHAFLVSHTPMRIPVHEMGSFDLWGWQFLWVVSLCLGARWAANDLPIDRWAERLTVPAVAVAVGLVTTRYLIGDGVGLGPFTICFDKWHLGAARMADFAAVTLLLVRFRAVLIPLAIRPFVLLGQASLQVYCVHLLFCFAGLWLMGESPHVLGWAPQAALITATLGGMLVTAKIFARTSPSRVLAAAGAGDRAPAGVLHRAES